MGQLHAIDIRMICHSTCLLQDSSGNLYPAALSKLVREHFKLTPVGIIDALDLRRPIFKKTAAYGHFGRRLPEFTWERTDKAESLAAAFRAAVPATA